MTRQIIVDNEYMTIEYLPERGVIYHTVHQPVSGNHLRDSLNAGTEFLKDNGVTKWLSDDRLNGPLPQEDAEWGFNDWNRRAISYGWKYWALVVPKEVKAAGSMIPVIENLYELGLRTQVFTDLDTAFAWLDKQK
jgi:hypothetical protein